LRLSILVPANEKLREENIIHLRFAVESISISPDSAALILAMTAAELSGTDIVGSNTGTKFLQTPLIFLYFKLSVIILHN
jgi:hypothetical protein